MITIEGPSAGYYNTNQTVIWYVSDDNLDPDQVFASHPSGYTFSNDGTYQVTINASDFAGNTATVSSDEFVIDKIIPETSLFFGSPHLS